MGLEMERERIWGEVTVVLDKCEYGLMEPEHDTSGNHVLVLVLTMGNHKRLFVLFHFSGVIRFRSNTSMTLQRCFAVNSSINPSGG